MPFKHLKKHWKRILPSFLHSAHKPLPVWNSFRCFILSPVRAFSHSILLFTVLVLLLLWERNDDLPFPSSVFVDHGSLFKGWPKKERKISWKYYINHYYDHFFTSNDSSKAFALSHVLVSKIIRNLKKIEGTTYQNLCIFISI